MYKKQVRLFKRGYMTMKMKNRSYRYDINRPRPIHGHKYTKYKMSHSKMMVICIEQHLSNM